MKKKRPMRADFMFDFLGDVFEYAEHHKKDTFGSVYQLASNRRKKWII